MPAGVLVDTSTEYCRRLYLDLLKRSVLGLTYEDPADPVQEQYEKILRGEGWRRVPLGFLVLALQSPALVSADRIFAACFIGLG